LVPALAQLSAEVSDGERIDRIRLLSEIESAAAAARAQETARFAASQRAAQAATGVPADRVGRGVAGQVALALRCSPARAQRYVGWATILTSELPLTFAALHHRMARDDRDPRNDLALARAPRPGRHRTRRGAADAG
jgi:hypothetical protein